MYSSLPGFRMWIHADTCASIASDSAQAMMGENFRDGSGSAKRLIVAVSASMHTAVWSAGLRGERSEGVCFMVDSMAW